MAWKWTQDDSKVLCVINYSDTQGSGAVVLSDAQPLNGNNTIPVTELFSGNVYYRNVNDLKSTGLFAIVDAWSAQIFKYQ